LDNDHRERLSIFCHLVKCVSSAVHNVNGQHIGESDYWFSVTARLSRLITYNLGSLLWDILQSDRYIVNLIEIGCCKFFLFFSFAMYLHPITPRLGSCHVTFISSLTVQSYVRQLNISTNRTTSLCVYSDLIRKDLVGSR
jgi:hypothetical protein